MYTKKQSIPQKKLNIIFLALIVVFIVSFLLLITHIMNAPWYFNLVFALISAVSLAVMIGLSYTQYELTGRNKGW